MRILVVEDEPRIAQFLSNGLSAEGFIVDAVSNGDQALAWIRRNETEFIILDLALPDIDGLEVLKHVKEERPDMSVLILSARRDLASKLAGLRGGARDYMVKPFSFDELVERIRIHQRARSASAAGADMLQVAGVVLDMRAREVDCGDGPIHLTGIEFRLLEYLMRNRGKAVSRQRLLSAVWGYSHEADTNVVDVSVRRVRQKIGHDKIETVRLAGYRFAD
jgi:DNA-binding response OmpR family regulator